MCQAAPTLISSPLASDWEQPGGSVRRDRGVNAWSKCLSVPCFTCSPSAQYPPAAEAGTSGSGDGYKEVFRGVGAW